MKKKCFKCGKKKKLSKFYKDSRMSDGHLGKCKKCTKNDVKKNYKENRKEYLKYEKKRNKLPHRIKAKKKYTKKYRKKNPEKYKAHCILNNAKRSGRMQEQPCIVCGTKNKLEAHHEDYSKPLEVIWLCSKHHKRI